LGALRSEKDPTGALRTYDYDVADRLVKATDAENRSAITKYDAAGRVEMRQALAPNATVLSTTSYTVDSDGNITGITNPRNIKTTFAYDAAGRVKTVQQPALGATVLQ